MYCCGDYFHGSRLIIMKSRMPTVYVIIPIKKANVYPKVTDRYRARVAAIVEKAPLTPNIRVPYSPEKSFLICSRAWGNGIPIRKVRGNRSPDEIRSLSVKLWLANKRNIYIKCRGRRNPWLLNFLRMRNRRGRKRREVRMNIIRINSLISCLSW